MPSEARATCLQRRQVLAGPQGPREEVAALGDAYGDRRDDGVVQLSFVLPVVPGERAREAAAQLARKMGLSQVHVAAMEAAAEGFAFFVVYGGTDVSVDLSTLEVPEVSLRKKGFDELNEIVARELGRRLVVLGACTGSDAHAVGIDAIMNMKGFAGDYGLERYPWFEAKNLGAPHDLVRLVSEDGKLPVPNFAAGGIATPADAALMMQLGAEAVFVTLSKYR